MRSRGQLVQQYADPTFDLVTHGPDMLDVPTVRIIQDPVLIALAGKIGQASPQPIVTTTSAARTTSSVHGFGYSVEMSIPRSAIAATAEGLTSMPGSEPPDQATAASPAKYSKNPSAIWLRPALCTHRNSTTWRPSSAWPSTRASAVRRWRANRSASSGRKLGMVLPVANWS